MKHDVLLDVYNILEDISNTSSRNAKLDIINNNKNDELFKKVVYYAYNPFKVYKTTSVVLNDLSNIDSSKYENINIDILFDYLDYLSAKNGATDEEKKKLDIISSFFGQYTVDITNRIVNKDLRCGARDAFKAVFPDIPDYGVMLCKDDVDKFIKYCNDDLENNAVFSEKKDGVRCTSYPTFSSSNKDIKHLSRNGKEFPNFEIFNDELIVFYELLLENNFYKSLNLNAVPPLDGEATAYTTNKKDKKTFQKLMTQVRRLSDINPDIFRFEIFDIMLDVDFELRYGLLQSTFELAKSKNIHFKKLNLVQHFDCKFLRLTDEQINTLIQKNTEYQFPGTYKNSSIITKDDIEVFTEYCVTCLDWEGIVLKLKKGPYQNKRSGDWCKSKKWYTIDSPVIGWEFGKKGKKYSNLLGKLICQTPDGKEFGVGSGFTDQERIDFLKNTPKLIEVKYQEITKDGIPRFPIFIRVREDKQ